MLQRPEWNTVIVGASIAGLHVAARLARAGQRVVLLERERSEFPRPRTLIVTPAFSNLLGPMAEGAIVNRVHRFEMHAGRSRGRVALGRPDLVIERSSVLAALVDSAEEAGVEVIRGARFTGIEPGRYGLRVRVTLGATELAFNADAVVGADGAHSRVARSAGWPPQRTAPLIQAIVDRLPGDAPDTSYVWFEPASTPYFLWSIPESSGSAAVGLIGENGPAARSALQRFLRLHDFDALSYQAARIPVPGRWRSPIKRIGMGTAYLVGDAAGHVKISTVGGVVTGLAGAAAVADEILGLRTPALHVLRRELRVHALLRRVLDTFSVADYEELLEVAESLHPVLADRTRDDARALLRDVVRARPQIMRWAGRALLPAGWTHRVQEVTEEMQVGAPTQATSHD